ASTQTQIAINHQPTSGSRLAAFAVIGALAHSSWGRHRTPVIFTKRGPAPLPRFYAHPRAQSVGLSSAADLPRDLRSGGRKPRRWAPDARAAMGAAAILRTRWGCLGPAAQAALPVDEWTGRAIVRGEDRALPQLSWHHSVTAEFHGPGQQPQLTLSRRC